MREIKFRAWDKSKRTWVKVACLQLDEDGTFLGVSTTHTLAWHEVELMQFTGLKDKNGKEIYEGDIVSDRKDYNDLKSGEIKFSFGMFHVSGFANRLTYYSNLEVIGNIYENKELLN